jgi:hypothetical protein
MSQRGMEQVRKGISDLPSDNLPEENFSFVFLHPVDKEETIGRVFKQKLEMKKFHYC